MAQSSLRQFYTVRKRPYDEHGSVKRRKLTEESRLDLPSLGKGADPHSLPFNQPLKVSTVAATSNAKTNTRRSTARDKSKGRGRTKVTNTRFRGGHKVSSLPATPSIVLSAPVKETLSNNDTQTKQVSTSDEVDNWTAPLTSRTSCQSSSSPAKDGENYPFTPLNPKTPKRDAPVSSLSPPTPTGSPTPTTRPSSPAKEEQEEDPLLVLSSPKTPKRDTTCSSSPPPSAGSPCSPASSRKGFSKPTVRSRMNLAMKLKLASVDPSTSPLATAPSPPSISHQTLTSTTSVELQPSAKLKSVSKLTAKELAQCSKAEGKSQTARGVRKKLLAQELAQPATPEISRGSKLSAKELAQPTTKEQALTTRNTRRNLSAQELTQPATPEISHVSKLSTKELAWPTAPEKALATSVRKKLPAKELTRPKVSESQTHKDVPSTDAADMVSRLYGLSAKELAQPTEPERRTRARVQRNKGKSPVPPTPHTPQLHKFESFVVKSPTKSPSKQPAYERHHALTQPTTVERSDLPLPYKYQLLSEKFRCTDTVLTMLQKRREICTFYKLKQAVEEMTRRKYENRNLAQMETVYPTAFNFRQEKNIPGIYDHKTYSSYQLTVECNVNEDGRGGEEGEEGDKKTEKSNAVLDSSALLRRRKVFNKNLGEITREHHRRFLSSLSPPLVIPDDKVLRWHPAFQLDMLPDIEEAKLPEPPLRESYTTARDVLNVAHERLAPRVRRALEGVAGTSEGTGTEGTQAEKAEGNSSAQINPALRGISLKLLEKIKQKEASHMQSAITRDPAKEKKLEMLARLPDLCRILRSFFVTEKKAAISWDSVVQKLTESHTSSLPPDRIDEHLEFMRESLGDWLSVVKVRKRRFVKITKNTDGHVLNDRMEATRKKLLA